MKFNVHRLPFNILLLSLVFYHLMVPTDSCPAGCSCSESKLDCRNPTFPIYLPSGLIKEMNICGNISRIPANAFVQPKETTLKYLRIYDSEISIIDSNAFNDLQVESFHLVNSRIKHLSPRVFYNLKCDYRFDIYQIEMDDIPTSLFEGLTTRYFTIHLSNITTFQTDAFKSVSIRTIGFFFFNDINIVQKNAFPANVPLYIHGNNIKSFLVQDSVVLDKFILNELQCSCGLVWMWENDSPFKEFLMNNTCIWPNGTRTYLNKINKSTLCKDGIWERPITIPYRATTTTATEATITTDLTAATTTASTTTTAAAATTTTAAVTAATTTATAATTKTAAAPTSYSCPAGCFCEESDLKCLNPIFPIYLPSGYIESMFIRWNIPRIPTNAFVQPKETTLKYLRIYNSEVSSIDSNAFNDLQVESFQLVNIKIKHLSPRAFYNLKCDNRFVISQTEMDVIPTSLFEGLTTGYFIIQNSNITTFQTDAFKSASIRSSGYFFSNNINTVQKNAFPANISLDFYGNKIKSFLVQDSVVLERFISNELQCSCGLVWMWEDDSRFKEFLMNNTCIWPNGTRTYLNKINKSTLCEDGIWERPTIIPYRATTTAPTVTAATTKTGAATTPYSCPAGCFCVESRLNCLNPIFPIYLPSGLIKMMYIRWNISRIPANAFVQPKETTLNYLRIYDSEVSRIDSNAFNDLQVEICHLLNSKIKHLSPRAFYNLKCNYELEISQTEMDVIPTSLFEGLTTASVAINNNNITTFQTDAFKSASIRTGGYFYSNNINTVQKNAFPANVPLYIGRNKIKSFLVQDSVVLGRFILNELQCSCGLVWMWEDDSPFKEFLKNNTCILTNETTTYLNKIDKSTLCKDVEIINTSGIFTNP